MYFFLAKDKKITNKIKIPWKKINFQIRSYINNMKN